MSISINPKKQDNHNGTSTLCLNINIDGIRKQVSLGTKCDTNKFEVLLSPLSPENNFRTTYELAKEKAQNFYYEQSKAKNNPTVDDVIAHLKGKDKKNAYTIKNLWFDFRDKRLKPAVEVGGHRIGGMELSTLKKYERAFRHLCEILGENFSLDDFDRMTAQRVVDSFNAIYQPATCEKYVTNIKAMINFAIIYNKMKSDPFYGIKLQRPKFKPVSFSDEEYELLKNVELTIPREIKVRDCFIFLANTGLAYTDMFHLQKEDIKYDSQNKRYYINKCRYKTKIIYTPVILDDGLEILKKYQWDPHNIVMSNQKLNSYIKDIAAKAGWENPEKLTCHKCRHYFITKLVKSGMNLSYVQKAAGHASPVMTAHYTHLNEQDETQEFNKFFPSKFNKD